MEERSKQLEFPLVNLSDPRQDVHRLRKHNKDLFRYNAAERLLPKDLNGLEILDLGGGTGELSSRLKNRGARISFTDMSEKNVQNAETNLGLKAFRVDLNYGLNDFADRSFDGVVILDVIEHIVAAEFLLYETNRVLRPNGFLILTVPNFAYFINRMRVLIGKLSKDEGYHYRFFNKKALASRLTAAGFQIKKRYNYSPFIGVNFILNKMLKKPRRHLYVPNFFSAFFAQSFSVYALKTSALPPRADEA